MTIQQKITYFTENMDVNFLLKNYIKLEMLEQEIRRHIKRCLKEKNLPDFNSHDLRKLVLKIEKYHTKINQKIAFIPISERFKKYDVVNDDAFEAEFKDVWQYMAIARVMQQVYSLLNYLVTTLELQELQLSETNSDNLFNQAILNAFEEFKKGV